VLKIRLRRTGAKKQPRYRVVVAESNAPRDGAFVEILGWYNPQADPAQVVVNTDKAAQWIQRGAQPSDRVAYLLKQAGLGQPAEAALAEAAAAAEPEAKPAARKRATKAAPTAPAEPAAGRSTGRTRATRKATEPAASEAPESEGSAASAVTAATDASATEAPESEGSAGASPA
jgi:small subunit ribosomal protein S16